MICAQAVVEILEASFTDAPWLQQIGDMVEVSVDRAIRQLSGGPPNLANGQAISAAGDYRYRPRTAAEIQRDIAAESGSVAPADRRRIAAANRAYEAGDMEKFNELSQTADPAAGIAGDAAPPPAPEPKGWIL